MIGTSPLTHPVAVDFPLHTAVPATTVAELEAWMREHDHPAKHLDRVVITERLLIVHLRGECDARDATELRSHPSIRMLADLVQAGALVCASLCYQGQFYRCNVPVDDRGRHHGPHADGRFGDGVEWPNEGPYPDAAPVLPLTAPPAPASTSARRRGVYVLGDGTIARALRLPAGQHIMAIATDFERMAVLVQAEGEGLPEVTEGCYAPTVGGAGWGMTPPGPHALAAMPPAERHAAVLAEVEATVLEDTPALQGRLRILIRHAPVERTKYPEEPHFCSACIERPDYTGETAADWPCEDYRDAAGGLLELPADPDTTAEIGADQ